MRCGELLGIQYKHPFIQKVMTKAQFKKDVDKDIIREILMLTTIGADYSLSSL